MLETSLTFMTPSRIRLYPSICLLVMLVAVAVYAWLDPTFLGADFRAFYTAGTFFSTGRGDEVYDVAASARFQAETLGAGGLSAWMSPPYAAWAFVPLSHLPFFAAFAVHTVIGVAIAGATLAWLSRELRALSVSDMAKVAALYYPTLQWIADGQTTSWWTFLTAAIYLLFRRGADVGAGVALGCFALKPQLGLGLAVALLAARRFRALVAATVTAGAWIALGYATLPSAMSAYFERVGAFGSFLRSEGYPSAGLRGLFQQGPLLLDAIAPRAATVLGATLTVLALASLVILWAKSPWQPGDPRWDRRMAATLALSAFASPHLFGYDLMLLLVPLFIVWNLFPGGTEGKPLDGGPLLVATALSWAFALLGPALTVGQQALTQWAFGRSMAVQLDVPVALAWIWLVVRPTLDVGPRPLAGAC